MLTDPYEAKVPYDPKIHDNNKRPSKHWKNMLAEVDIAGLKELSEAGSFFTKTIWLLIILAAFAGLIIQLYFAVYEYINNPVSLLFLLVHNNSITQGIHTVNCFLYWTGWVGTKI